MIFLFIANELPLVKTNSEFFKYVALSENIVRPSFLLKNFTSPETFNIFFDLLYTKFSAIISKPSLVSAFPLFEPIIRFPSSTISISVTLNRNCSSALELTQKIIPKKKNKENFKNLFFINIY